MDFSFSQEQESIREAISKICGQFDDHYWLEKDRHGGFPTELHQALAKDGWLGICIPEQYGGSGLGITEASIMMQTISESGAGMSGASAVHMKNSERFVGLAMLPMQAPALALRELDRAAKLPGMRGLYLATHINGVELDDKAFWDVYARAEEIGWPVFLHPMDTIGGDRTGHYYLKNLLGNPYDTGVAAASLIFGGVLDAFPKLEVNLPHAGGAFPGLIGRLDHGTKVRAELKHMKRLPSDYLRRFTYDTIGHDDRINMNLVRLVGADRVLLGSDYCFDMGLDDPVASLSRLKDLSTEEHEAILGKTAAGLLKL